jgi:organic radical activating enzyme
MNHDIAVQVIKDFARLGCKSVTITGGGEPLMHPYLPDMIRCFTTNGIKVGLVSNGLLMYTLPGEIINDLTWCRISSMDHRTFDLSYQRMLRDIVNAHAIDWAFSHVVGENPNWAVIEQLVDFANENDLTHVRLVGDLLAPETVDFSSLQKLLHGKDQRVIYQPRTHWVTEDSCFIAYIKPVINPDFKMYMCCGVQYALDPPSLNMPDELCMGSALNLDAVYSNGRPPFPVNCKRCYYNSYNVVLRTMRQQPHHIDFV